jgi:hypothetical protein
MAEGRYQPDLAWVGRLAQLDDGEIRMNLMGLPAERQVELVLSVGWADRLRILRNSDEAAEIVKGLPREEVFLTLKQVGEEDALPILALTTPSQLRFILDIELWKKDELDGDKVVTWLKYLLACGESKIIELVNTADMELLALMLRKIVYLIPNEEDAIIPEGLPSIMLDEYFTILSNIPEETENIGLLLRILRQTDRDLFYKLLFATYSAMEEETQEAALRWRNSRLEESGFLDFDEAVEIYGYVGEEEARRMASVAPHIYYSPEESGPAAPAYPVLLMERRTFFYDLLRSIEDRLLENRLRQEIAFSANRLLVADAEHIGEIDSIKKALARLFSLVNVGLLFLTSGEKEAALDMLRNVALRDIFQIGFSRVADLKTDAAELARRFWPQWAADGFGFLDRPQDEIMRGLTMRVPQYSAPAERSGAGFRDFETMEEVRENRRVVDEIGVVAETCFDKLGIPRPHEAKPVLLGVFASGLEEITLRSLLLTGFVNLVLKDRFDVSPLAREDMAGLFEKALEIGASGRRVVKRENKTKLLEWLAQATGFEASKAGILERFVAASMKELEDEVGGIRTWQDVDPRYIRALIFKR